MVTIMALVGGENAPSDGFVHPGHYLRCGDRVDETGGGQDVFREELTMDPAVGRVVDGDDVSPIGAL